MANTLISGTSGNDSIYDYGENYYNISNYSTINAGKGNDSVFVGYHTNLSVYGGAGSDTINSWRYAIDSTLNGGAGNDSIYNEQANSLLIIGEAGLQSASTLIIYNSGDGNDTIWGFNSTDSIKITGATYSTTKSGSDVIIKVGNGRINLKNVEGNAIQINGKNVGGNSTNPKLVILNDGGDLFSGNLDDITISGGNGDDYISNGDGLDKPSYSKNVSISGGAGDDSIYIFAEEEHIPTWRLIRSPDNSTLNGGTGNDLIINDQGENVIFQYGVGDGNDTIKGFNETSTLSISGGSYSTTKSGNDIIVTVGNGKISLIDAASLSAVNIKDDSSGGSSSTTKTVTDSTKSPVTVGSAIKTINASKRTTAVKITGNALANTIKGGSNKDTIQGGAGNDSILGNAGNDQLYGNAGKDTLFGGAGNDTLWGGDDNDQLYGNAGNDSILGGNGNDSIKGQAGADKLYGNAGNDSILGGDGNDLIKGQAGTDKLYGNAGNDSLYGGDDKDSLWGGTGNDFLWGGKGTDVFTFLAGQGTDYVMDYESNELLRIYNEAGTKKTSFSKSVFNNDTLKLTINGGGTVIFNDVDTSTNFNINGTSYKISGSKLAKK